MDFAPTETRRREPFTRPDAMTGIEILTERGPLHEDHAAAILRAVADWIDDDGPNDNE